MQPFCGGGTLFPVHATGIPEASPLLFIAFRMAMVMWLVVQYGRWKVVDAIDVGIRLIFILLMGPPERWLLTILIERRMSSMIIMVLTIMVFAFVQHFMGG